MNASKLSLVEAINDSKDRWRIVVRVLRRWNVYQKDSPTDVVAISMLLADQVGTKIQASILNKGLFDRYDPHPAEGSTYFIENFVVYPNTKDYRVTNHQFRITLGPQTYIKELQGAIPDYSYSFFPISEIRKVDENHPIDYLIDVIGYVSSIGSLEEFRLNGETKNRIRLCLADEDGRTVNCVLYDQCAVNVCLIDFKKPEPPIVMIIQLARIGFEDEGLLEVCSSYYATKVSINEKCPEVKHFIQSTKEPPSPITSIPPQSAPAHGLVQSAYTMLRCNRRADIDQIPHQDSFFVFYCEIIKLETRHGWMYNGCSKCGTKLRSENSKAICMTCKRLPIQLSLSIDLVHYTVQDDSGRTSVVFFDKVAVQLIGRSALELKVKLEKEDHSYDFPDELDDIIGKKLLIKAKVNKYNVDFPNSSIIVTAFSECSNLMDEFDDVVPPGSTSGPGTSVQDSDCVMYNNVEVNADMSSGANPNPVGSIVVHDLGLDEIPTQKSSVKTFSKGKRKQAWKKVPISVGIPGTGAAGSPSKATPKPNKAIKQEKM